MKSKLLIAVSAILGGGISGCTAAMLDPTKYNIHQDLGSGKLWKFFFMGAALTLGGIAQGRMHGKGKDVSDEHHSTTDTERPK